MFANYCYSLSTPISIIKFYVCVYCICAYMHGLFLQHAYRKKYLITLVIIPVACCHACVHYLELWQCIIYNYLFNASLFSQSSFLKFNSAVTLILSLQIVNYRTSIVNHNFKSAKYWGFCFMLFLYFSFVILIIFTLSVTSKIKHVNF